MFQPVKNSRLLRGYKLLDLFFDVKYKFLVGLIREYVGWYFTIGSPRVMSLGNPGLFLDSLGLFCDCSTSCFFPRSKLNSNSGAGRTSRPGRTSDSPWFLSGSETLGRLAGNTLGYVVAGCRHPLVWASALSAFTVRVLSSVSFCDGMRKLS